MMETSLCNRIEFEVFKILRSKCLKSNGLCKIEKVFIDKDSYRNVTNFSRDISNNISNDISDDDRIGTQSPLEYKIVNNKCIKLNNFDKIPQEYKNAL